MAASSWHNRIVGTGEESPDQLLANPRNFRTHPKHQQDALSGVLDEVGWVDDVIVNRTTGHIIDGHLRVSLALRRGETVPVKYVELTEAEEALILATFDPIAALAVADKELLESLLNEISTSDAAVTQMLADLAEQEGIVSFDQNDSLTDPDDVPEPPDDPITKPGDLWTLGRHRLLCGDSTNRADVDRLMGGVKADMVFTDPPYGVDYDGGTKVREKLAADHRTTNIYGDVFPLLAAYSDPKAPFYIWHAGAVSVPVLQAIADNGYEVRAQIIWNKNLAQFGALGAQYKQKHEPCFYAFRKGQSPYWYGPTNEVTVWDVNRHTRNDYHPTQKPVELAERAINNSSQPGNIVLDLFGGSGSTLIACESTERSARLMELDPIYCDVICKRFFAFTGIAPIREGDGAAWDEVAA